MVRHNSQYPVDLNGKVSSLFLNQFVYLPKWGKNATCACVGSSPILLDNENGELIDSHDIVIRMNDSRIKGYEKHTGTKTSIRMLNGSTYAGTCDKERFPKGSDESWVYGEETEGQSFIIKSWNYEEVFVGLMKTGNRNPVNFLNADFVRYCNEMTNFSDGLKEQGEFHEATTGFIGIIFATMFFKKVNLFGFSFFEEQDWKKYHFYEEVKSYKPGHKFENEKTLVKQFEKEGKLKIYR